MNRIIFLLSLFVLLNCKTENTETINIELYPEGKKNIFIGKQNGLLPLKGKLPEGIKFEDPDFESKTKFDMTINTKSNNEYKVFHIRNLPAFLAAVSGLPVRNRGGITGL